MVDLTEMNGLKEMGREGVHLPDPIMKTIIPNSLMDFIWSCNIFTHILQTKPLLQKKAAS